MWFPCRHIDIQTNGDRSVDANSHASDQNVDDATLATFGKRPVSMYEQREGPYMSKMQQIPESRTTTSMYQMVDGGTNNNRYGTATASATTTGNNSATSSLNGGGGNGTDSIVSLPRSDEVKLRTEIVTRCIQELWNVMQDTSAKDVFVPCAERIRMAVNDLTAIFPVVSHLHAWSYWKHDANLPSYFLQKINDEIILYALKQLNQSTSLLQRDCVALQQTVINNDTNAIELYMKEVRNGAYNLAKATKTLVTQFQWSLLSFEWVEYTYRAASSTRKTFDRRANTL